MKYKDLPKEELVQKLLATSFENPKANLDVYRWSESVLKHIRFVENERIKLIQKLGNEDKDGNVSVPKNQIPVFMEKFKKIIEMDIEEDLKECPVKSNWFDEGKCCFPKDKSLWLTPAEIGFLTK